MVSVESKGEKRMVNSKYYQGLEQDCIVKDDTGTIHLSSYGSHLVNKRVQRVKNHKKTNHHNFEGISGFLEEHTLKFFP